MTKIKFSRALGASRYCINVRGVYIGTVHKNSHGGGWTASTLDDKWGFGSTRRDAVQDLFHRRRK